METKMIDERDVEYYLKKQIELRGGQCWKFTSPGTAGVPDRVALIDGAVIFIEVKKPGGHLTGLQRSRLKQIEDCGVQTRIVSGRDDVDAFMRALDCRKARRSFRGF